MQEVVFSAITQGVCVLTSRDGNKVNGMTAAWVAQVSFKPLLIMVSVAFTRYSHELIKKSGIFALNVLTTEQVDLGKRFGYKSGRRVDKFAGLSYDTAVTGAPILPEAYAYLDLKLVHTYPAGDHDLFIGEVVDAKILHPEAKPLIFKASTFF
ncbi:MAG: flavin reductase [Deltaproteobacteria bacterium]|nr:flavin reductase [Deltaproteobacteria bacterium]MBW1953599.1 flavin reductase [Deltaproteobacteria bacterium]MBW1986761.1 flavin reductase [Deltaproteobacteria bacterium]MBW2135265.1 flavin reductase [Deltaproteobacteria bacterium]